MSHKVLVKKICMLGGSGVGKTCLVERFRKRSEYIHNKFVESTIGASFSAFNYFDKNNNEHRYQVWDTAGQERYNSLAPMYYRQCAIALIVYDVTSYESWERARHWYEEINAYRDDTESNLLVVLLGNKFDLENMEIDTREIAEFCINNSVENFFCSALNGHNIESILSFLSMKIAQIISREVLIDIPLELKDPLDLSKDRYGCYTCPSCYN